MKINYNASSVDNQGNGELYMYLEIERQTGNLGYETIISLTLAVCLGLVGRVHGLVWQEQKYFHWLELPAAVKDPSTLENLKLPCLII